MSKEELQFETIAIGTQTWSTTNLSLVPTDGNSWSYDNDSDDDGYGRLYDWDAAMNVCPDGWHLPSDDDWKVLEAHLGMSTTEQDEIGLRSTDEGTSLKEGGVSGFNAKLAGIHNTYGSFIHRGDFTIFWSSTESGSDAYSRTLSADYDMVYRDTFSKAYGFSVRLIKDK